MERHRGELFGDQPEHHRAPHPGGPFARFADDHVAPHDRSFDPQKAGFSGDGHHHHHNNHYHNHPHSHNQHFNGEINDAFSCGAGGFRTIGGGGHGPDHFGPFSGRKRWLNHSGHDYNGAFVKLYVGCIPKTVTEEDIRSLFEEHGKILEVVLLKDKRTGQQQECCFVKYTNMEEADRAIKALNNQRTLPGGVATIKVRYADGERERLANCPTLPKGPAGLAGPTGPAGPFEDKLYVGHLNKQATKREIEEIFSPYGIIEDIFIVRDDMRQSRGCGFVKLSNRDMAVAAINALNGNYAMRGCDQPLIVRFADPKKPRIGESRGHVAFGSPKFGPRSQEPLSWPAANVGDPMCRENLPYSMYPGSPKSSASSCQVMQSNSGALVQAIPAHSQPQVVPQTANQQPNVPIAGQQPLHAWRQSPLQESQQAKKGSQSLKEPVSEMQKQLPLAAPPTQNLEQQQSSHVTTQQTGCNPQTVASSSAEPPAVLPSVVSSSPAACASTETADLLECDWSEHTCPDGFKYYYNCETCESKVKFFIFENLGLHPAVCVPLKDLINVYGTWTTVGKARGVYLIPSTIIKAPKTPKSFWSTVSISKPLADSLYPTKFSTRGCAASNGALASEIAITFLVFASWKLWQ